MVKTTTKSTEDKNICGKWVVAVVVIGADVAVVAVVAVAAVAAVAVVAVVAVVAAVAAAAAVAVTVRALDIVGIGIEVHHC